MSDKKTYYQEEQIRRYLHNEMTSAERNAFEREMQKDPFLADAVDGLSAFPSEEIISDIQSLKTDIQNSRRSSRRHIWYAAASILVIVVSTFILFNIDKKANIVVTENTQQLAPKPQGEVIQEPQILQKNETEQKAIHSDKNDNNNTRSEIAASKPNDTATQSSSTKKQKKGSLFNANLTEHLKLKKSFPLAEDMQMAKNESQTQADLQQTPDQTASEEKPLIQTVSIRDMQKTTKAARTKNAEMQLAISDSQSKQPINVSGMVTDSQGNPLLGVTISLKGSGYGAITNADGKYSIPNVQDSNSLVYSFIGMETQEIPVTGNIPMNITLKNDDSSLSEVVVISYGSNPKKELTGSAAGIDVSTSSTSQKAIPSDGWKAYNDYLKQQLSQPNLARTDKRVVIRLEFEVDSAGHIGSFKILSSDNEGLNNEAIRIIQEGPVWLPAYKNSAPYPERVKLKLVFPAKK